MISVAAYQLDVVPNNLDVNLSHIEMAISKAASTKVNLLILPELITLGYDLSIYEERNSKEFSLITQKLDSFAQKYNISFVVGTHNTDNGSLTNAQVMFSPDEPPKVIYEKCHLFPGEEPYFKIGKTDNSFSINGTLFRSKICYDLRFPECFRIYGQSMPHVFILSAAWPLARISHWKSLLIARAIENQAYIVASNRIGTDNGITFGGTSLIINPNGEIIGEGSQEHEELIVTSIASEDIVNQRSDFSVLDHMKFTVCTLKE